MALTWTVVEFLESQEVEAVPTNWLYNTDNKMKCYWPPLDVGAVERAIKNQAELNTCWPLYDVRVFKNGTFADYKTARLKSKKAEDTSDLSSCDEGKRKRKMRPLSSDEEDESEGSILPPPPPLYSTPGKQYKKKINEPAKESAVVSNNGRKEENDCKETTGKEARVCCCCPLHNLNQFEKLLSDLLQSQKNIRAQVLQLRDDIKSSEQNLTRKEGESFFIKFKCPISSQVDVATLETYLEETNNYNNAVIELSKLGGRDLYDFVRRCLSSLMKNSVAQMYSYHGKKNKLAFKNLKINNLILEAATLRKDADKRSCEDSISKWLKRAKERKDE